MPYPEIDPRAEQRDILALTAEREKRNLMRDQLQLRRRYEESLIEFMIGAWPHIGESGKFLINWHHAEIADALEQLVEPRQDDMGNWSIGGNLVINQPPRTTKSSLLLCFNAWVWAQPSDRWNQLRGPHVKFLTVSYSTRLAEKFGTQFRRLILGEWYQALWGHQVIIRADQGSRADFANTAGGSRFSGSIIGGVLGSGGDIQLIDDPQNYGQAESEVRREGTTEAMRMLVNRVTDPRHTARILVMQRLHQCLLPGTLVRTPNGQAPIEALRVGDQVLGSDGWQVVTATDNRPFQGMAYGVRLFGHPEVCWTTPNHRYLTKRGWQRADALSATDWVRFPAFAPASQDIPWEEPRRAEPPAAPTGNFQGGEPSIGRPELVALVATGISNTAIAERFGVHRNTIQCYLWLYRIGRIREANPWFGRDHLDDPMFWRLVGYWLAEGCFMHGRGDVCGVRFTFHIKETDYQAEVEQTLARYGVTTKKRFITERNVCQMESNSSQLARWLKTHFGSGARWKALPEFVMSLPDACRGDLLEGWLRGDGCIRQTGPLKGQRSGTSVSVALIHGMQRLALSLRRRVNVVQGQQKERLTRSFGYASIQQPSWELRLSPEPRREGSMRSKIEDGQIWYQIKEIATKPYEGMVYDITTPSHDFVVGNATVHNSDATQYAIDNWSRKTQFICFPMRYDITRPDPRDHRENDGELLWPDVWTEELVTHEEAELLEYGSAGQLQQRPVPRGGGIIKHDWWKTWPDDAENEGLADLRIAFHCPICKWADYAPGEWSEIPCPQCGSTAKRFNPFPQFSYRLVSVDTNYGEGEQNSFSAATAWAIWHAKDGSPRVMLTDAWRGRPRLRGDPRARDPNLQLGLVEIIYGMAKRRQTDVILIERKTRGTDLYNELERLVREWPYRLEYTDPTRKGSKTLRLEATVPLFINGLVWAPNLDYAQQVIEEVCAAPFGAHDDLMDTATAALRYFRDSGLLLTQREHRIDEVARTAFRGRSFDANEVFGLM